jgi:NADPH-dependent glutamate synthase beta subunit-like oxidoreductase
MTRNNPYRYNQHFSRSFSFEELYAHPGSFADYDASGLRKQVAIIGAGAAELASAYELKKLGHSVTVFEAMLVSLG